MPINIKETEKSTFQRQLEWYEQWTARNRAEDTAAKQSNPKTAAAPAKTDDKEALRKQREAQSGLYVDTIQRFTPDVLLGKDKESVFAIAPEQLNKKAFITDAYRWLWNRPKEEAAAAHKETPQAVQKADATQASVIKIMRRVALEAPCNGGDNLYRLLREMNQLLQRIKETEEDHADLLIQDVHRSDPLLFRRLIDAIKQQKANREEGCLTAQNNLMKWQEIKKTLHTIMMEIHEKQMKAREALSVTNWIGIALSIGIAALFVAAVVASIVTAGAALPAAIATGKGLVGVASGVNTGIGGYYQHQTNEHEKELIGVKHEKDESHNNIKLELEKHKDSTEWVTKQVALLGQISKSRREAARYG